MSDSDTLQRVWLTLYLEGGHKENLSVMSDSPLLPLLGKVLSKSHDAPAQFQLLLREGTQLLTLPSHRLVTATTEPPVSLLAAAAAARPIDSTIAAPIAQPFGKMAVPANDLACGVHKSKVLQVKNVLTQEHQEALLKLVASEASAFTGSTTTTNDEGYRRSSVLYQFSPFDDLIRQRVRYLLPKVAKALEVPVPAGEIDVQLTAHNDNNYYKVHNDNGNVRLAHRKITYIYYFYREPKAFTGGELRVYDSEVKDGYRGKAESYRDVEPLHNSLVFFDSGIFHEVLPVNCPSKAFMDSRFTLNGWICAPTTP